MCITGGCHAGSLKTVSALKAHVPALAFFNKALAAWASENDLELTSNNQMV